MNIDLVKLSIDIYPIKEYDFQPYLWLEALRGLIIKNTILYAHRDSYTYPLSSSELSRSVSVKWANDRCSVGINKGIFISDNDYNELVDTEFGCRGTCIRIVRKALEDLVYDLRRLLNVNYGV